ncbi:MULTISPECIES: aldose epimerase family protein [Lactobacillaceae]|uniref:Maltose epimerase n=1 Tax=Limosilactobacillus alvi TaxID=990412 RepID=A0ABS2EQV9_9LACO|nr:MULTISPECIES: aldose epimerase family protein [Lactobacillaceae]MBM6754616.1 galactose mutarotase [Limosilactobacillus alvi]QLL69254.1 galactose mutarotase [Lactobacillus sp. 3B(2020)]
METSQEKFGEFNGQDVIKYTLTNEHNVSISVLNYGGVWQAFMVPGKDGQRHNLLLSSDNFADFHAAGYSINRVIGPTAGRIENGEFTIDGKEYHVDTNENGNTLHGGSTGWGDGHFWNVTVDTDQGTITLQQTFTPADDTYPGTVKAAVVYTLGEDDSVTLDFYGESDENTLFNPTNHTYWNIADESEPTIEGLDLQINSKYHLAVKDGKIPTGERIENAGTPYDFSKLTNLGEALNEMLKTPEKGFDDYFEVTPSDTLAHEPIAILHDQKSGRTLKMFSDRNGLVMFSTDGITSDVKLNRPGRPWMALALEGQTLPDTPHHPSFGDVALRPADPKHFQIHYEIEY